MTPIWRHISGPLPKKLSGTFDVDLRIRLTLFPSLSLSSRLFPSYLCTARPCIEDLMSDLFTRIQS